jgi:hypothetical protein
MRRPHGKVSEHIFAPGIAWPGQERSLLINLSTGDSGTDRNNRNQATTNSNGAEKKTLSDFFLLIAFCFSSELPL